MPCSSKALTAPYLTWPNCSRAVSRRFHVSPIKKTMGNTTANDTNCGGGGYVSGREGLPYQHVIGECCFVSIRKLYEEISQGLGSPDTSCCTGPSARESRNCTILFRARRSAHVRTTMDTTGQILNPTRIHRGWRGYAGARVPLVSANLADEIMRSHRLLSKNICHPDYG